VGRRGEQKDGEDEADDLPALEAPVGQVVGGVESETAKSAAAGPWKSVTRRNEKNGRFSARTIAREASAEEGRSPRSSARSTVVIGRMWRPIM
jgi:hypothetical protein